MDKSILLQKQIRDNNEDLQKEFRDLEAWQQQMKKKDEEVKNMKCEQNLPPVRSKKKKVPTPSNESSADEKPVKMQRIPGNDYRSWDKFDADAACKDDRGSSSVESKKINKIHEIRSQEELEKEHAAANKLKEEGNNLVKQKEFVQAIGKYTQAIKLFPHDAAFYANRALCHLKIDNLYSAESDCTQAITFDSRYVKAYHRRAKVRIEMKRFDDAKKDLEEILRLEPSNKEATILLKQVRQTVGKKPKPLIIAGEETEDISSIGKKIGEQFLSSKPKNSSFSSNSLSEEKEKRAEKPLISELNSPNNAKTSIERSSKVEYGVKFEEDDERENLISIKHNVLSQAQEMLNALKNPPKPEEPVKKSEFPSWLPKLKDDISIIKTSTEEVQRPLHRKLTRVNVKEIPDTESIFKDVEEHRKETPSISEIKSAPRVSKNLINEQKVVTNDRTTSKCDSFPPVPKSSVGFLISWRKDTSRAFRYRYLKQIEPKDFPDIFKESMESNIFSDILSLLATEFIESGDKVYDYLDNLSKLKRFRTLILFMTSADKEALTNMLKSCLDKEGKSAEEVQRLRTIYEM